MSSAKAQRVYITEGRAVYWKEFFGTGNPGHGRAGTVIVLIDLTDWAIETGTANTYGFKRVVTQYNE